MGWTGIYTIPKNVKEYLTKEMTWNNNESNTSSKCLTISMVGNTAYAAIEYTNHEQTSVYAMVILTKRSNGEFMYKDMSEDSLPYYFDCPKKILNMLSPTDNERANEWRNKCLELINNKKAISKKKLEIGMTFKLKEPLKYSDGSVRDTFVVVDYFGKKKYKNGNVFCSIPKINQREYDIIGCN